MPYLKRLSEGNDISLDSVCYFKKTIPKVDNIGNNTLETDVYRPVFCTELSISSSEFYNAGKSGVKSECLLVVDIEEYDNETSLKYLDTEYSIYRTYKRKDGLIELYCKR